IKAPCLIPWFSTYITAIGNVLPCCYLTDENDENVMGNIYDSSFDVIWNGDQYKKFRKQLRENRENLNVCNSCVRDDSSRIKQYGLFFRRKMLWRL
ncbi:SPASM domain-containing protein, partial [Desulfococcaceae bacterium HSG9]|nr:SPASM domain-containing protein [Desulfococcaceae bacterium HSG9]